MRKIGIIIFILGLTMLASYYIYYSQKEIKDNNNIEEYIEETSITSTEEENIENNYSEN